jgi:hypothetical protein
MPTFAHAHSSVDDCSDSLLKKKNLGIFYPRKYAHGNHGNPRIREQFCSLVIVIVIIIIIKTYFS